MKYILSMCLILVMAIGMGQTEKYEPYNPKADAEAEIKHAIIKAKADNKHVLIMVGGNW